MTKAVGGYIGRLGETLKEEPKQEWRLTRGGLLCAFQGSGGGHREGV